jgi:hypothetical protein
MIRMRPFLLAFAVLSALPVVVVASIQQQRAQITVTITVDVTPTPIAMRPPQAQPGASGQAIAAHLVLNRQENPNRVFRAENLTFADGDLVAATTNQGAVEVRASIAPNPSGTLLYSDQSGVIIDQMAGTTQTYSCEYHVTVDTTITNWSLDHGLYTDFEGSAGTFTGHDMLNNSYLSTPLPTYTPFIVYNDGQNWALLQANTKTKTYCIDLKLTIPSTTAQGSYSSNAVYTLYY